MRNLLIETAQKLHDSEPDAQLLLVDDDIKLQGYIAYAKAVSGEGYRDRVDLPGDGPPNTSSRSYKMM